MVRSQWPKNPQHCTDWPFTPSHVLKFKVKNTNPKFYELSELEFFQRFCRLCFFVIILADKKVKRNASQLVGTDVYFPSHTRAACTTAVPRMILTMELPGVRSRSDLISRELFCRENGKIAITTVLDIMMQAIFFKFSYKKCYCLLK